MLTCRVLMVSSEKSGMWIVFIPYVAVSTITHCFTLEAGFIHEQNKMWKMGCVLHWCRYHLEHCTQTGKSTGPITCTVCGWYGWNSCSCNMHQMTMWFAHIMSAVCHLQTGGILVTRWRTSSLYSGMHVVPNQPALSLVTSRVPVSHSYWMVHAMVVWCGAYLWGNLSVYVLWACLPHKPARTGVPGGMCQTSGECSLS